MEMPEVFTVCSIQTKPKLAVTMARNIAIHTCLLRCWVFLVRQKFCIATQLGGYLEIEMMHLYFFCICWKPHQKVGMLVSCHADKLVMSRHTNQIWSLAINSQPKKIWFACSLGVFGLETWTRTWTQTAIMNELGLRRTRVDLDILDTEIFQRSDKFMPCVT